MVSLDFTFVASIVNFLLLVGLLVVFLYRPIRRFMREREEKIRNDLLAAEEARKEAEKLKAEYDAHLTQARQEVHDIIERAVKQGEEAENEIIQSAHEESRRILERANQQAAALQEEAWMKLQDDIVRLVLLATSKVAGEKINPEVDEKLVAEFIEQALNGKAGDLA